jgi:glycerophosphoryl diester phosphodiesterase
MKSKVIASECCSGLFPKNTLAGFRYCIENAFDGIEFDVHLSADGQVVVQHDYLLNPRITRDSSGNWLKKSGPALSKMELEDIKTYDVGRYAPGSHEDKSYPDYQPNDNEPIPAFREFLEHHSSQGAHAELWVELKTSPYQRDISSVPQKLLDALLKDLVAFDLIDKTVLLAFEWDVLVAAKALQPGIRTDFLTINPEYIAAANKGDGEVDPGLLFGKFNPEGYNKSLPEAIDAAGGDGWGPLISDVSADDVKKAQALGLEVNLWGVGTSNQAMDNALLLNPDSITIGRPDLLALKLDSAT